MERLSDLYWREHGFEGLEIEQFLENVRTGTYGQFTREQIRHFLYSMEGAIIDNIETKAGEAPQFATMKDEIIDYTVARFQKLRADYAP